MTSTVSSLPTPISVSTSQAWDNDGAGLWSTFVVQVGTPAQDSRVIISTAGDETWVVVGQGCIQSYGSNCAFNRGGIFSVENSTSWVDIGLFSLELESNLGYTGNGQFGYDSVTLGYPNSGGITLQKQVVAGLAAPDFWLGSFGLDPTPSNFTNLNDPQPSFLWNLVNESLVPSTSWGYTAGAYYRYDKVQGSLTLGGYDASRFDSKNVTFPLYNDVSRRYLVDLRSITYMPAGVSTVTNPTTLMSETLSVLIDSTVPYIYLPTEICDEFASAFGLEYNSSTELYTINSTMHTSLGNMNPSITFTLANTGGDTLDIVIPYAAFDLTATFPVLPDGSNSSAYFPLKRAANDTQYTLGRVFLQEAYLIADFDRSQFVVAPCVWPPTFTEDIKAIIPPSANTTNPGNGTVNITKKHSSAPVGAIVGGVVGGLAVIAITLIAYWYFIWKPNHRKLQSDGDEEPASAADTAQTTTYVQDKPELAADNARAELTAYEEAEKKRRAEAEIDGTPIWGHEMPSPDPAGRELESPPLFEMPAREPVGNEMASPIPSPKIGEGTRIPRKQVGEGTSR
ncbi:hypothetical protein D0Z07_4122 [Hyphodiscus hymeniophilus]|uniref:Peptidase A1 domain-containing protein n=1 Tax=Hyphodiscus hymeniophilus TaxID=353542 RepID=A0A9P6VJM3_9HELO|nr:hypothetical protein D0Z07_4122 [Hyphodiscus hymeniophilus]